MKILFSIAASMAVIAGANAQAYGSGVDGQSVFRVSQTQVVTATATAALSVKLASETRVIRLGCTEDCHFKRASGAVSATINDSMLFGGATEYFKVPDKGPNYIGVIRDSADGKMFIDEMVP